MTNNRYPSWGNFPVENNAGIFEQKSTSDLLPKSKGKILARGLGRSYGDSCLNNNHNLLLTHHLNHIIDFDVSSGEICCESGVTFEQLFALIIPQGWFAPVTPGTKFITVGGAVANDVHGKNHHNAGTFGRHVKSLELLRSDGERITCAHDQDPDLLKATIGGLGLTGFILNVTFQLKKNECAFIETEINCFKNLEEFSALSQSHKNDEYLVSWVDSLASGEHLGRGVFISGQHVHSKTAYRKSSGLKLSVPFYFPSWTLNKYTVAIFNKLYFAMNKKQHDKHIKHYEPFFFPLDNIGNWNRIYGRGGFVQYQCVLPHSTDHRSFLETVSSSGFGSFLSVLKTFGDFPSEGLLSFPMPGITIALDFPVSRQLLSFLDELDKLVMAAGGRVYIAKDARMSAEAFHAFYPQVEQFQSYLDPEFSSSFWRRVMGD